MTYFMDTANILYIGLHNDTYKSMKGTIIMTKSISNHKIILYYFT